MTNMAGRDQPPEKYKEEWNVMAGSYHTRFVSKSVNFRA
jgi:hypothetical protein